jgi:transposase-like protein
LVYKVTSCNLVFQKKTKMTTNQAVDFAFDTIKEVKQKMIVAGLGGDAKEVFAACNKIAGVLKIELKTVTEIFEIV